MSTASLSTSPALQTPPLPAVTSHTGTIGAPSGTNGAATRDDTLEAAQAFEKLLIHDMLKTMRRTAATLGEKPSNARSMYDDMLDERLAGIMSEAGGLGLAETLAGQLDPSRERGATVAAPTAGERPAGDGKPSAAERPASDSASSIRGLRTADVIRLRALVRPDDPDAGAVPAGGAERTRYADVIAMGAGTGAGTGMRIGMESDAGSGPGGIDPHALIRARIRVVPGADERVGPAEKRAFIDPLLPHAEASARRLGTSPDVVLAIAALESGWGRHVMRAADGTSSHNLFGIKARPGESGAVSARTHEYVDGARESVVADFRAFADPAAAVSGFADFVLENPRYARALEHADDPNEFLRRLHAAGYATDPRYADKAIETLQRVRNLRESLS